MFGRTKKLELPRPEEALRGREARMPLPERHAVLGHPLAPPFPSDLERAVFGMGCFWGAERKFWKLDGVYTTAVGYAGGFTPNPTYEEVVQRGDRPRRGGAGGVRPAADRLRRVPEGLLGVA